jgi:hypothetical protein
MSRRTWLALALAATTIASLGPGGCGQQSAGPSGAAPPPATEPAGGLVKQEAGQPPAGKDAAAAAKAPIQERKIIYIATLDIVVKDLDEAAQAVDQLLATHKGRIVRSEARSDTGVRRTQTFTLEVPVANFGGLVNALKEIGTTERDAVDSQDVTEEYVDIQARLKNLREQEDKLNELLKEKRKEEKLEDVIRVSDRIYEVRGQIERVEGRMKYLETRSAFSTVTLTLREIKDYQPPTAPTFDNRVSRTFEESWEAFVTFLENVALAAVAITPWLPLLVPMALVGILILRKLWRVATAPSASVVPRAEPLRPRRAATAHDAAADVQVIEEEPPPPPPPDERRPT